MNRNTLTAVSFVFVFGLAALFVASVAGPALASHGSPGDWEIQPADPPEDAQPGAESASYIHWAQGGDDFRGEGLEEVHNIEMQSQHLDFSDCTLFDVREFGIDRGANNEGTETDDDIAPHVREFEFAEDRMWMAMYRQEDAGGSPMHLRAEDQFVAHQLDCYGNPDEAGWYQIEGWANGTAYDGDFDEARLDSHYFWICDCEDESAAREQLGPPPSEEPEDTPTPTPTPEPVDEVEDDTSADEDDGPTDDEETTPEEEDDTSADEEGDTTDDETVADEDEAEAADDEDDGVAEPTPADGPGFGAVAALAALLGAALFARRL